MSKLLAIANIRRQDIAHQKASYASEKTAISHFTKLGNQFVQEHGEPLNLYASVLRHYSERSTSESRLVDGKAVDKGDAKQVMFVAAEFKRASPSKGIIAMKDSETFPSEQALTYVQGGASLVSVLTEEKHFKGTVEDMLQIRKALHGSSSGQRALVLRKDFIVDELQLFEAKAYGADTLLLIVAILSKEELVHLLSKSRELLMEPLVEVATEAEMLVALQVGARVIGVNNRNLHNFKVDLNVSVEMAQVAKKQNRLLEVWKLTDSEKQEIQACLEKVTRASPAVNVSSTKHLSDMCQKVVILALSGIKTRADVEAYERMGGIAGLLIGETLMRSPDPASTIQSLLTSSPDGPSATTELSQKARPLVKICGIKTPEVARITAEAGADFIGLIFVQQSKRYVSIEAAQSIVATIRDFRETEERPTFRYRLKSTSERLNELHQVLKRHRPLVVGVFQNSSVAEINHLVQAVGIDIVQLHDKEVDLGKEGAIKAPVVRVIHVDQNASSTALRFTTDQLSLGPAFAYLLDTTVGSTFGGSGKTFDWSILDKFRTQFLSQNQLECNEKIPLILAGGLTPENVATAAELEHLAALDVASGVEMAHQKGEKDLDKVKLFISSAKQKR